MKSLRTILGSLCFLLLTSHAFSQMTKSEAQLFIDAHAPSTVEKVFVTKAFAFQASANDFAQEDVTFIPASTVIIAMEHSLRIKDGTGLDLVIPYTSIKCLSFQPESEKFYSSISVSIH